MTSITTPPTTPRTAPTTVPDVGEVSRKAYVAGMERIWSARFCIVFSREGEREVAGSGIGSSRVTSFDEDREMNADERSRTKRMRGSVRVDMGAMVGDWSIVEYGGLDAIESNGRVVTCARLSVIDSTCCESSLGGCGLDEHSVIDILSCDISQISPLI